MSLPKFIFWGATNERMTAANTEPICRHRTASEGDVGRTDAKKALSQEWHSVMYITNWSHCRLETYLGTFDRSELIWNKLGSNPESEGCLRIHEPNIVAFFVRLHLAE